MRVLSIPYQTWKTVAEANTFQVYVSTDTASTARAWAGNAELVYATYVDSDDFSDFSSSFSSASLPVQSEDEAIALIVGILSARNMVDADGHRKVSTSPRLGSEIIFATHNLCDPTTWAHESVRVSGAVCVDSGDGLVFSCPDTNLIDLTTGKVLDEEDIASAVSHGYETKVYVNGQEVSQRGAFETSGGDFSVDYSAGQITFFSSRSGDVVTADYSRAAGSGFILAPLAGKALDIEDAEAQFSVDVVINDSIVFEVYGNVEIFAPHLTPSPLPAGTKIPLTGKKYKTLDQLIDEAKGSFPVIPAMGGARGATVDRYGFPFRYGTVRRLLSSQGLQLKVSLENDQPCGGERATATFYCTSKDE